MHALKEVCVGKGSETHALDACVAVLPQHDHGEEGHNHARVEQKAYEEIPVQDDARHTQLSGM